MTSPIKIQLYDFCITYLQNRENTIRTAIAAAQQAGNEETKSSAGDKYETTRSMMQLEIEQNAAHLKEVMKLKQAMDMLSTTAKSLTVQPGSVIITDKGNFYLSISAGTFHVDGKDFVTLSPASPLGTAMIGCKAGETFSFRGKGFVLLEVT